MFNSELRPVIYREDSSIRNYDGSRALFERSEEPEFVGVLLDTYMLQHLSKNAKLAGQRLA